MVMTAGDALFVDTNILVYATEVASPWHQAAIEALNTFRRQGVELVISPQIINEYLAATTRHGPGSAGPSLTLAEITANVETFLQEFTLVPEDARVVTSLAGLVQAFAVGGKQVHDANIVATMQAHGIRRLLTHNTADFARFAGLITVVPLGTAM